MQNYATCEFYICKCQISLGHYTTLALVKSARPTEFAYSQEFITYMIIRRVFYNVYVGIFLYVLANCGGGTVEAHARGPASAWFT